MSKTWFITGSNRGLGLEMVRAALDAGDSVVGTARNVDSLTASFGSNARFLALSMDVTDAAQIADCVDAATARFGRIDVLVNNAGYGQFGWFETLSDAEIRAQFETNVFGAMKVTQAVLPVMRANKQGHVFTISSEAGIVGSPGMTAYCASKFAVEGWMLALAMEINPLGLKTTLIEPGPFKTDFLDDSSLMASAMAIEDYAAEMSARRDLLASGNHAQAGDPAKLAQALVELAAMTNPPMHFAAGASAVAAMLGKAKAMVDDVEAHRALALGTDFPAE